MPHLNIKYFAPQWSEEKKEALTQAFSAAVEEIIGCSKEVISIAMEPVAELDWKEKVYQGEIIDKKDFLTQEPHYNLD